MSSLVQFSPSNTVLNARAGLLGSERPGLPVGGKIKPGIKILTPKAMRNERAQELYKAGIAAGHDFDAIEATIRKAVPALDGVLMPTNRPYFTVWPRDFGMPEVAQMIVDKFGEDRGDGEGRQLYRFPVIFPTDDAEMILPHALRCWGAGQLKYWSEYADNDTRQCMQYAPIHVVNGKRVTKLFGGRKVVRREQNGGVCDPENCREYQADECKLNGSLRFFIPGIPSIHAFELPTTSWYSLSSIRKTLLNIAGARGGRVSGYLHGDRTFWIAKRLQAVSRITQDGKAVREDKWLIVLEGDVDMGALLLDADNTRLKLERARDAAAVLDATVVDVQPTQGENVLSSAVPECVTETLPEAGKNTSAGASEDDEAAVRRLRVEVFEALSPLGIPAGAFSLFMRSETSDAQWGVKRTALETGRGLLTTVVEGKGEVLGRITNALRLHLREQLVTLQIPDDVFSSYWVKRTRNERWETKIDELWKAIEFGTGYAGKGGDLLALIQTELDLV